MPKERNVVRTVEANEDLMNILAEYGIKDWKQVYEHEKNAELRKKRPNPHILYKGDKLFIPELPAKEFVCETNKLHTFTLYPPQTLLHMYLKDDDGEPYGDIKFEIWIEGEQYDPTGKGKELKTRKDGLIFYMVPVTNVIELRVWFPKDEDEDEDEDEQAELSEEPEYETIKLFQGHIDPIDTVEGVQDRLFNLGYDCGDDPHGELKEGTEAALRQFQVDCGLVPTKMIDDVTRKLLLKRHGS
ncbi:MAG: peptidoglycan-binding domain-containing protein [Desulfobacterales bacterium]